MQRILSRFAIVFLIAEHVFEVGSVIMSTQVRLFSQYFLSKDKTIFIPGSEVFVLNQHSVLHKIYDPHQRKTNRKGHDFLLKSLLHI